ncbi:hypothetical protein L6Q21_11520 [Sandaracinobacter sp. RS1-74]|uniref:hypothetical protein n=1 Tax=Sandaracinobacteroides sayramensis TaxID=2913411 RepID=UPI001EDA54F2|nr:hypothetical protein [Sandaracinobacteroides sayramensis]MCG2841609.1 hypothetical protein [Sandaracinobacteroides sayramensis]
MHEAAPKAVDPGHLAGRPFPALRANGTCAEQPDVPLAFAKQLVEQIWLFTTEGVEDIREIHILLIVRLIAAERSASETSGRNGRAASLTASCRTIARAAQLPRETVRRRVKALVDKGLLVHSGGGVLPSDKLLRQHEALEAPLLRLVDRLTLDLSRRQAANRAE